MNKRVIRSRIIRYSSKIFGNMDVMEGELNIPCFYSVGDFEVNAKVDFKKAYNANKETGVSFAFVQDSSNTSFTVYECLENLMQFSKLSLEDRKEYLNWLKAIAEDVKNDTL